MATKKTTKKRVKNGIHIFRDKDNQFRWNITKNGRVLADSGEAYKRIGDAKKAMNSTHAILADFYIMANNEMFHDETK